MNQICRSTNTAVRTTQQHVLDLIGSSDRHLRSDRLLTPKTMLASRSMGTVTYHAYSYGCDDEHTSVPTNAVPLPTNVWRILPILLYWKINPTSDRPSKNSTNAILLDPTVEPLRHFHSLYEILLCFYISEFHPFLYQVRSIYI